MGSSLEQVQEWLTKRTTSADAVFFIIAEKAGNKPMGYVQLLGLEQQDGTGRLGICLDPKSQGKGYGGETLTLLADYAHDVLHLSKITLDVLADNHGAIRLYKRNGYHETDLRKAHFNNGTTFADVVVMETLLAP
jgi:RimJ/RimL family protein N-acetyltransferase